MPTNSSKTAAQSGRKSRWVSPAPWMPMNISLSWELCVQSHSNQYSHQQPDLHKKLSCCYGELNVLPMSEGHRPTSGCGQKAISLRWLWFHRCYLCFSILRFGIKKLVIPGFSFSELNLHIGHYLVSLQTTVAFLDLLHAKKDAWGGLLPASTWNCREWLWLSKCT